MGGIKDTITTFLIVDDDPRERMLVELAFEHIADPRIRLKQLSDGDEAIAYLKREGCYQDSAKYPAPHVILLDIKMPRVNGFEFLKWLRHQAPAPCNLIPVVVMSSSTEKKDIDLAYSLGANTYFVKPIDWNEFRTRLRALGIYWTEHAELPNRRM